MSESSPFLQACAEWKKAEQQKSSFGFVKLGIKAGVPIRVRFLDAAPLKRVLHYESLKGTTVICPEHDCLFCSRGDKRVDRFFINVVDRADDRVKVLEFSAALRDEMFEMVKELAASGESKELLDPRNYDLVITRTGTGKDTRYAVAKMDGKLTATDYKSYDLEKYLVPMNPKEMVNKQESRPAPVEVEKPVGDFGTEPPPVVPSVPDTDENPLDIGDLDL